MNTNYDLRRMWSLWWDSGLRPHEYHEFNLRGKTAEQQAEYIGLTRAKKVWAHHNRHDQMELTFASKLLMHNYLQALDVPLPELVSYSEFDSLRAMITKLQNHFPIFAKPVYGSGGKGCFIINRVETMDLHHKRVYGTPYIFQKQIDPAKWIHEITRSYALPTIRFVTCYEVTWKSWAFIKLPGRGNIVDNYNVNGNRLAYIDPVVGGFDGVYTIPMWEQYVEVAMKIANEVYNDSMRRTCLLGIDIGITEKGPVVIEVNTKPGLRSLQIALGKGLRYEM